MRKLLAISVLWTAAACSAANPVSFEQTTTPLSASQGWDGGQPAVASPLAAQPEFGSVDGASEQADTADSDDGTDGGDSEGPTACPTGMVLVEGDYCTEVEHECIKHWYDKSNKKKVCEKFAPKATCVGKKVKKRFCIDKFAWPNVKGERPEVMNNFYQAQVKCAAVGKRMCTESEWTMSCEGPEMKPFPYGFERDARKCNGDHKWDDPNMEKVARRDAHELGRLWRGVTSGSQPQCVSDYGVYDLPGNNDEVVSGESRKAKYASVHTGGPWYKGVRNQCRPKIYSHDEGFYYYFLGFRCCAAPDGQQNDPRTKLQIEKKWRFSSVERLARFTTAEMKDKLALKKKGKCDCGPKERLCKTMCGTLLGDNAKDGDDTTRKAPGR